MNDVRHRWTQRILVLAIVAPWILRLFGVYAPNPGDEARVACELPHLGFWESLFREFIRAKSFGHQSSPGWTQIGSWLVIAWWIAALSGAVFEGRRTPDVVRLAHRITRGYDRWAIRCGILLTIPVSAFAICCQFQDWPFVGNRADLLRYRSWDAVNAVTSAAAFMGLVLLSLVAIDIVRGFISSVSVDTRRAEGGPTSRRVTALLCGLAFASIWVFVSTGLCPIHKSPDRFMKVASLVHSTFSLSFTIHGLWLGVVITFIAEAMLLGDTPPSADSKMLIRISSTAFLFTAFCWIRVLGGGLPGVVSEMHGSFVPYQTQYLLMLGPLVLLLDVLLLVGVGTAVEWFRKRCEKRP